MSLTKEQLLSPRFKVIADFPDSDYKVGGIEDRDWAKYVNGEDETEGVLWKISQFPHLFKQLEWWEERIPEDMPRFVKLPSGEVHSVTTIEKDHTGELFYNFIGDESGIGMYFSFSEPSTEEDYNSYINKQK